MKEKILSGLERIFFNRHEEAKKFKRDVKIIGYLCSYTPEEIIHASRALPVRILGSTELPILSYAHLGAFYCSFSRTCIDQALKGEYAYLDGLVGINTCVSARGIYEIWKHQIPLPYTKFICMPSIIDAPEAEELFLDELKRFRESLEKFVGKSITDEALFHSIKIHNTNRHLLREIYKLRQKDPLLLTGTETWLLTVSSTLMPKEIHNQILSDLLGCLSLGKEKSDKIPKLMLIGSMFDRIDLLRLIESLGTVIIADDLCTGSRNIQDDVAMNGDPLEAISLRYLRKVACPTKYPNESRLHYILNMAKNVDGVIFFLQKFCQSHGMEYPYLARLLSQKGVPHLFLEIDTDIPIGQLKTRIEAFLEMVESSV